MSSLDAGSRVTVKVSKSTAGVASVTQFTGLIATELPSLTSGFAASGVSTEL